MKYYYAPPSSLAASSHLFLRAAGEVAVVVDLLPHQPMCHKTATQWIPTQWIPTQWIPTQWIPTQWIPTQWMTQCHARRQPRVWTEAEDALVTAEAELAAIKDDQESTQAQIAIAEDAVDAAEMTFTTAQTAHTEYLAMQPPTYDMAALALQRWPSTPGTFGSDLVIRDVDPTVDTGALAR